MWCSFAVLSFISLVIGVSMPHAALCVVQQRALHSPEGLILVSMPHAALCVVQRWGQAPIPPSTRGFNAARGFVCGAASSLAALVPLREKSPFGKSPEI